MSKILTVADLWPIMQFLYPEVEDERNDNENHEHPMTPVGLVLLSAAVVGTTKARDLVLLTGYSRPFISAIIVNMQNNKLWIDGLYDCSEWLSSDGTIDKARFWDHIEIACGSLWLPVGDTCVSADPCMVYWNEQNPRGSRTE